MSEFNLEEYEDLSGDGGLLKKIIQEGEGDFPSSGDEITAHCSGTLDDGSKFDSSRDRNKVFRFTLGQGRVIKGWDQGFARMKKGEKAILRCRSDYAYGNSPTGIIPAGATLNFDVELINFGPKQKEKWELSEQEKIVDATSTKEKGNIEFNKGNFEGAANLYLQASDMIDDVESARDLWVICQRNAAQSYLNLNDFPSAAEKATLALSKDPNNLKALYRRGLARNHLGLAEEALNDLNRALSLDPENKQVKAEIVKSKKMIQEAKKKMIQEAKKKSKEVSVEKISLPKVKSDRLLNELLLQARNNLQHIYTFWRDFLTVPKYNNHPIILFVELESIFQSWNGSSSYAILYSNIDTTNSDPNSQLLLKMFNFLGNKRATTCGVIVSSAQESFLRPVILIDFGILFNASHSPRLLNNESLALQELKKAVLQPDIFNERWDRGVIELVNNFNGKKNVYFRIQELIDCKDKIIALATKQNFFSTDISNKLNEINSAGDGFGIFDDDGDELLGFSLFKYEDVNQNDKTLRLHIEYLLVAPNTQGTGVGFRLTVCTIQRAQNLYPGYTINVFVEAKTTTQAVKFWLGKMGFTLGDEYAENIYYPATKIYSGNTILDDYEF